MLDSSISSPYRFSRANIRNQRFLIISSVFPPDVIGGAEVSAYNLSQWLRKQGAQVAILTTAKTPDEVCSGVEIDGLKIWKVWMPRLYPQFYFAKAKWWQKPIWHLQDHIDPRNKRILGRVLDEYKPDFINIHVLQGIGYNTLPEIAKRYIPVVYFLHDLALGCFRMGMFKNGRECVTQCAPCKISAACKLRYAEKLPVLAFCSPSQANIDILSKHFPVQQWNYTSIMNANNYPAPEGVSHAPAGHIRFLYVGRIHSSKGVTVLLEAANNLAEKHNFVLTIIGSGPDEASLREKYGSLPWCKFTGFIPQSEVGKYMVESDVLCIPSVWAENSPGVVIQALGLGLPVIGSDKGGIPELVEHGKNGLLVPPDNVGEWQKALATILENPSQLAPWRDYALQNAFKFNQDFLGNKILNFIYDNE